MNVAPVLAAALLVTATSDEARIEGLLGRLTLEEKCALLGGAGEAGAWFGTRAIDRLGIPSLLMADGPVGVRWGRATAFPASISMAASFDPDLVERYGRALGRETRGIGRDVILGPCVNIHRAPRGGRNFESFGEDPWLSARTAVAYIRGVQSEGVAATVKHFACNDQETDRDHVDVRVDERALHEIHLPAFRAAVEEAGVLAVMSAYNKVNGDWCGENRYLLDEVLKRRWGFRGMVMSDWGGTHSDVKAANAGLDLEMPEAVHMNAARLVPSVRRGEVDTATIDDKVRRLLRVLARTGRLDGRAVGDSAVVGCAAHRRLAREMAVAGTVLLRNDGLLPLPLHGDVRSIAVLGPNAAEARTGGGGSSEVAPIAPVSPLDGIRARAGGVRVVHEIGCPPGDDLPPLPSAWLRPRTGSGSGLTAEYFANMDLSGPPAVVRVDPVVDHDWGGGSPDPAIPVDRFSARWTGRLVPPESGAYEVSITSDDGMRLFLDGEKILDHWSDHAAETRKTTLRLEGGRAYDMRAEFYENGGGASARIGARRVDEADAIRRRAVEAARAADVAVVCVGLTNRQEHEGADRPDLALPPGQDAFIEEVAAANPRTVVVVNAGASVLMDRWIGKVAAVLLVWYPGEEGGNALADVLFGDADPGGRLPTTFWRRPEDVPSHGFYPGDGASVRYREGIFVGYRHADRENIAPLFPFGHGLSYADFAWRNLSVRRDGDSVEVALDLADVSRRAGSEVVQVYVGAAESAAPAVERPVRELKAFRKVRLDAGAETRVVLRLGPEAFSYYDVEAHAWRVAPGRYRIGVGRSSRDLRLEAEISFPPAP